MSAVTGRCRACAFLLRLVTGTVPVTVCNARLAAKPAAPAIFVADQKAQDTCALLRRLVGTTPSRFSNRVLDRAGIFPARSAFLPHKPNLGRTNSMQPDSRLLVLGVIAGVSMFGATAACAADGLGYVQTNLVSNGAISARTTDPDLLNAWGIGFFPGAPFWVADNGAGVATLYDGTGAKLPLVVEIPPPHGSLKGSVSAPTGLVANVTTQFNVHGSGQPTRFIFDTEDGTIAAWDGAPPKRATIVVDNSGSGAIYKGLALGANAKGNF